LRRGKTVKEGLKAESSRKGGGIRTGREVYDALRSYCSTEGRIKTSGAKRGGGGGACKAGIIKTRKRKHERGHFKNGCSEERPRGERGEAEPFLKKTQGEVKKKKKKKKKNRC